MKKELTNRFLESLKPPETGRLEISDSRRQGLRFRLSATGSATWMFEKRVRGGKKRKHTLGTWPEPVSLSDARAMALEIEAEASRGIDRVEIAEAERIRNEASASQAYTVQEVLNIYDKVHLSTLRRGKDRYRQLEVALSDHLSVPIAEIGRADFQRAVDAKADEGYRVAANRTRAALLAFSRWAWGRSYISTDIGAGIPKATKETARERVLSLHEVRQIWEATDGMGDLWGPALRLMILTAQRRGEILGLRWDEIILENAQIVKPGSRTKNGKPHTTHLSRPALEQVGLLKTRLADGETIENELGLVFTTTGNTPPSGVSKAKTKLDKLLGDNFQSWNIHDLRTAFATAMVERGIPENVADRVLNHSAVGSAPSAVARVYNRAGLLEQRARALDLWAQLVTEAQSSVVKLHG
ncbi:MAG: integrase [Sulfitobacter sp.]|jgi:integrase